MKTTAFLFCLLMVPFWLQGGEMALIPAAKGHPAFYMNTTETTKEEFIAYQKATTYKNNPNFPRHLPKKPKTPMVEVSWFDAEGFCRFYGKRLPTLEEWERAAGLKRLYPWGNDPLNATRANYCDVNCVTPWHDILTNDHNQREATVGSYPQGATPEGVLDLAGNVWEWTATIEKTGKPFPWKAQKDYSMDEQYEKVFIKGGSFGSKLDHLKNQERFSAIVNFRNAHVGFRCVKDTP